MSFKTNYCKDFFFFEGGGGSLQKYISSHILFHIMINSSEKLPSNCWGNFVLPIFNSRRVARGGWGGRPHNAGQTKKKKKRRRRKEEDVGRKGIKSRERYNESSYFSKNLRNVEASALRGN